MTVNLVIGFPGEKTFDWLKTIWFVFRHRKYIFSKPNLAICDAIAGSDLYLYPEKFNIEIDRDDPQFYMSWKTKDGKNTYFVRKFRRDIMDFLFSRMKFQESRAPNDQSPSWKQKLQRIYIAQPRKPLTPMKNRLKPQNANELQ